MACFRQERNTLQIERLADWGVFMGELGTAVLVTAAAGIGGTGLGGGAACLLRRESDRMVSLMLSFAAGVMIAVVCADLLVQALSQGHLPLTAAGVLTGFLITAGLNACLSCRPGLEGDGGRRGELILAGIVMAAAIALHNVPEGMVIGAAFASGEAGSGWVMAAVIGLHNVPEGMAVAAADCRRDTVVEGRVLGGGYRCSNCLGRHSWLLGGDAGPCRTLRGAELCLRGHAVCGVWGAAAGGGRTVAGKGPGSGCGGRCRGGNVDRGIRGPTQKTGRTDVRPVSY